MSSLFAVVYALAGRLAVPDALQVADRFQLIQNVTDALNVLLRSRQWYQLALTVQPAM